jgi:hypothetical protein
MKIFRTAIAPLRLAAGLCFADLAQASSTAKVWIGRVR